jgi:type III pantothenate kinase
MPSGRRPLRKQAGAQIVVDVGNSRIKWGLCDAEKILKNASLPPDQPSAWLDQLKTWKITGKTQWIVAGVHPRRRDEFVAWVDQQGGGSDVTLLTSPQQLPLKVDVPEPDRVGIDRLLNAVAANWRRHPKKPAFIVDAGSALTVDLVDDNGVFRGGAILPGLGLMAKSLHDHTALLPLVKLDARNVADFSLPAKSTSDAITGGILCAVVGGVRAAISKMLVEVSMDDSYEVFFAGGDAEVLAAFLPHSGAVWPTMTLEGMRIAAMSAAIK